MDTLSYFNRCQDGFDRYRQGTGFHGRIGFGERPAILVVDMNNASTYPRYPAGTDMTAAIEAINRVLGEARRARIPRVFTTMAYELHMMDMGLPRRLKRSNKSNRLIIYPDGQLSEEAQLDPRLNFDPQEEMFFVKKHSSCFFGTPLLGMLVSEQVDTIILTGCSTTGCIRATAIDALAHGFRTVVPFEAVADRLEAQSDLGRQLVAADLVQIDAKYADVEPLEAVLGYLSKLTTMVCLG